MITQTIDLDIIPNGINSIKHVHVSQRDTIPNGLIFRIWNGTTRFTIPSGATATIEGTKPDGHGFDYNCTISNNTVIANLTYQMTCVPGYVRTEIRLKNSTGNNIGTCNFYLDVELAGLADTTDISDTEIPVIIDLAKKELEEAKEQVKLSESWAIGGTGTRTGEDTNNSKYWSTYAESWAHGGTNVRSGENTDNSKYWSNLSAQYATDSQRSSNNSESSATLSRSWAVGDTNTRSGEAINNSKYYTSLSESWAVGGTGKRYEEDVNNSKYYSEQSSSSAITAESWAVGNTGTRDGENTDNSKYYVKLAESYAHGSTNTREGEDSDNSKFYYLLAKEAEESAKMSQELVETYADIIVPTFYLDFDSMILYQTNEEGTLQFTLDDDKTLYYEVLA